MNSKGKINITLNDNRDGLKILASWENDEDRKMVEKVMKMFSDKIEYIKVDIKSEQY